MTARTAQLLRELQKLTKPDGGKKNIYVNVYITHGGRSDAGSALAQCTNIEEKNMFASCSLIYLYIRVLLLRNRSTLYKRAVDIFTSTIKALTELRCGFPVHRLVNSQYAIVFPHPFICIWFINKWENNFYVRWMLLEFSLYVN